MDILLEGYEDERLRADLVWTPAWGTAQFANAQNLTPEGYDPRHRAWFDGDLVLSNGIADRVPGNAPVYDLLMLFAPGRTWIDGGDGLPGEPDEVWTAGWSVDEVVEAVEGYLPDCEFVVTE